MRLIIFDIDGTLVDSQATIVACTQAGFAAQGLEPPPAGAIRRIIGLSLVPAMETLLGRSDERLATRIAEGYCAAFAAERASLGERELLFPGSRELLAELAQRDFLLGVATGKAMRGLGAVLEQHQLGDLFVTLQTADRHPSKPHPSMILTAMEEVGADAAETMMIGDTSYDMAMAHAAGVTPVGVSWGNHADVELRAAGAVSVLERWDDLWPLLSPQAVAAGT